MRNEEGKIAGAPEQSSRLVAINCRGVVWRNDCSQETSFIPSFLSTDYWPDTFSTVSVRWAGNKLLYRILNLDKRLFFFTVKIWIIKHKLNLKEKTTLLTTDRCFWGWGWWSLCSAVLARRKQKQINAS